MSHREVEKLPRCQHEICDGDNFHLSVIAFQQNRKSCLFLSRRAVREYIFRKRVNFCFQNIICFFCIIIFWEIFCVPLWSFLIIVWQKNASSYSSSHDRYWLLSKVNEYFDILRRGRILFLVLPEVLYKMVYI